MRQHFLRAAAQGMRHKLLDGPPCPPELLHVWQWFCELDRARGSNGFGVNPLAYGDIAAWAGLTGREPRPLELALIVMLDQHAMKTLYATKAKTNV